MISTVHPTHFDTVVEVEGNTVRLTEPPENLIFEGQLVRSRLDQDYRLLLTL